jgi:hypothetical protein
MLRTVRTALGLLFLLLSVDGVVAQTTTPSAGTQVRYRLSSPAGVDRDFTFGTWVERGADFVVVEQDGASREIPIRTISQFEMLSGQRRRTGEGALIGSSVGAVAGLVTGLVLCGDGECFGEDDEELAADLAWVVSGGGAVVGAVAGALLGATHNGDEWRPMTFDSIRTGHLGISPRGLTLSLRF